MTQHMLKTSCPFADSVDGIPVNIVFTWKKVSITETEIDFVSASIADEECTISPKLFKVLAAWAFEWFYDVAHDVANDIGWDAHYAEHGPRE